MINTISYVLDARRKLFELHFFINGQIKMFNFGRKTSEISTFSSYDKLPGWIKMNMDSEEVMEIVNLKIKNEKK